MLHGSTFEYSYQAMKIVHYRIIINTSALLRSVRGLSPHLHPTIGSFKVRVVSSSSCL